MGSYKIKEVSELEDRNLKEIKEKIIKFVGERSRTFPELITEFPILEGNESYIEFPMKNVEHSNIIYWTFSKIGTKILIELLNDKKIGFKPMGSELERTTYLIDGGVLKLPIAKRPPKSGYKKLHWLPVWITTYKNYKEWLESK